MLLKTSLPTSSQKLTVQRAFYSTRKSSNTNCRSVTVHSFNDFFRNLFDFENWAPKSTRAWRLQQTPEFLREQQSKDGADMVSLEARINALPPSTASDELPSSSRSFSDADDDELAAALSARLATVGTSDPEEPEAEQQVEDVVPLLSGPELRSLVSTKYGKTHDMSFVRRDIPGKSFVCLNIMWTHLEQRSFQMTEEQYDEKIDSVAYLVNALGVTQTVRSFLQQPPRSQNGLPPRPVVGTAICIRFDLEQHIVDEWFGRGYQ